MKIVCSGSGSGAGALFLAIALKVRDSSHDVVVYERNARGVTYGWGVVYWDGLLVMLREVDRPSADAISERSCRWVGQQLAVTNRAVSRAPGHGYGMGRPTLRDVLTERA